jgi:hypothetical protein
MTVVMPRKHGSSLTPPWVEDPIVEEHEHRTDPPSVYTHSDGAARIYNEDIADKTLHELVYEMAQTAQIVHDNPRHHFHLPDGEQLPVGEWADERLMLILERLIGLLKRRTDAPVRAQMPEQDAGKATEHAARTWRPRSWV